VALTVVGVFVWLTWHNKPVGLLLSEAMLIVLAHYFASRRLLTVPAHVRQQLETQGLLTEESNPLWLPRHTIRVSILAALFLTGGLLVLRGDLFNAQGFSNISLIFAYLFGVISHYLQTRRATRPSSWWRRLWMHLKALVVVLACLFIILSTLTGGLDSLPDGLSNLLLGWILFYFGSR